MKFSVSIAALAAFSIAANAAPVKAQSASTSKAAGGAESDLKDSVKSDQGGFSKLIDTLMKAGSDAEYPNGFAQVVGLDGPKPIKAALSVIHGEGYKCHVVYENTGGTNHPLCVYFVKSQKTKHNVREQFLRVNLDGKLEKAITLQSNLDETGKAMREGRSKLDEDIDSTEVKTAFNGYMKFWVQDWLKKEQKLLAKKGKTDGVRASAAAAEQSLDKAAPASAPTAQ